MLRSLYERRGSSLELAGRYDDALANDEEWLAEARALGDAAMELAASTALALIYSTPTRRFDADHEDASR